MYMHRVIESNGVIHSLFVSFNISLQYTMMLVDGHLIKNSFSLA